MTSYDIAVPCGYEPHISGDDETGYLRLTDVI